MEHKMLPFLFFITLYYLPTAAVVVKSLGAID